MIEIDTHCSRCGGKLQPTPSFTRMLWTCGCGGQSPPQRAPRKVLLRDLIAMGPGTRYKLLDAYLFGVWTIDAIDLSQDTVYVSYREAGLPSPIKNFYTLEQLSHNTFELIE